MPQESLRKNPLWRAEDLGKPVPNTPHAISVCLPRWQDVVGYEERDPAVMEKLALGYPRFLYHPLAEQAFNRFKDASDEAAQIYTTRKAAERCRAYLLRKQPDADVRLQDLGDLCLVAYPQTLADPAKEYWQHAGEGISSRCAEALLNGSSALESTEAEQTVKQRLAQFTGAAIEDIYLFPSGMAAINAAFLSMQTILPDRPSVQFAFPYGDTLKLQEKMGTEEALFYPRGDQTDFAALEKDLGETAVSGLFCEFPTNPLLTCVDLERLQKLSREHDFPLIVDDTLGACINLNILPHADATVISLTKFFSGTSDVMGGALILNSESTFAERLRAQLQSIHEPHAFYPADIVQLEKDSRCCRERVETINQNTLELCEYLLNHPAIETVYSPCFTDKETYDRYKHPTGGYGGLFSILLKDAANVTETFYDALEITKGPNLGTSFSLCCPFVLLAHYDELDWAEAAGASRWLIRVSTGIEPVDELIARFDRALAAATS